MVNRIPAGGDQRPAVTDDIVEAVLSPVLRHHPLDAERPCQWIGRLIGGGVDRALAERRKLERRRCVRLAQRRVAFGRGLRVELAEDLAELDREADHPLGLRLSLHLDRVEQLLGRESTQHEVELPGEIRSVPQAGAEALPQERRRQVGGVPDEEGVTLPHLVGEHRAELVDRCARERPVLGLEPGLEERPDAAWIVKVLGLLAGKQHELPAAVPRPALDVRRRPPGIAPLAGDRQVGQSGHVVGLRIHHQPALLEAQIPAPDPGRLSDERVRPVGADDPVRAHGLRLLGRRRPPGHLLDMTADREGCAALLIADALGGPAAMHGDAVVRTPPVESPFELGLEEQVVRLPARLRRHLRSQGEQLLAVRAEPAVFAQRDHLLGEAVGQAAGLQQAHDLVVDVDGARQAIDLVEALERGDAVTRSTEHAGEGLPDGPVAHDGDVELSLHRPQVAAATAVGLARTRAKTSRSSSSGASDVPGLRQATNRSGRTRIAPSGRIPRLRAHMQRGS